MPWAVQGTVSSRHPLSGRGVLGLSHSPGLGLAGLPWPVLSLQPTPASLALSQPLSDPHDFLCGG